MKDFDVVVVGGGIAGLCAASFASSAGARVALYEASPDLGGRARTRVKEGYYFYYGPHALYRRGALDSALRDQGVVVRAKPPIWRRGISFGTGSFIWLRSARLGWNRRRCIRRRRNPMSPRPLQGSARRRLRLAEA